MLQVIWLHPEKTPIKEIDSDIRKAYMWVYFSGSEGPNSPPYNEHAKNMVLYDHQMGRSGSHDACFLDGLTGCL
ncbi:transposase [Vibrio parahaemolyticus]